MTAKRIYRWTFPITDIPSLVMPYGAEVLSIAQARSGPNDIELWAIVDPGDGTPNGTNPNLQYRFHVIGTGNPIPDDIGEFIGTVITHGGAFVWHVFHHKGNF